MVRCFGMDLDLRVGFFLGGEGKGGENGFEATFSLAHDIWMAANGRDHRIERLD